MIDTIPNGLERAIRIIQERNDVKRYDPAKNILRRKIKHLLRVPADLINYEELGICYYYDLRIQLKTFLHEETDENVKTCEAMLDSFTRHELNLLASLRVLPKKSPEHTQKSRELKEFYKQTERYYFALQNIYHDKHFLGAEKKIYGERMGIKQRHFFADRQFLRWLEFALFKVTSDYGRSFVRWGFVGMAFAFGFATIYFFMGAEHFFHENHTQHQLIDYLYFSVVTFTTLGYGDIVPATAISKVVVTVEVLSGYIMLGLFISLIQRRL